MRANCALLKKQKGLATREALLFIGRPNRDRTCDPRIKSPQRVAGKGGFVKFLTVKTLKITGLDEVENGSTE